MFHVEIATRTQQLFTRSTLLDMFNINKQHLCK